MKKQITLIAGHDTSKARELMTLDWLKEHGVKVEEWNGLQVLTIIGAEMNKGQYTGEYCVGFDNAEGDPEESYLDIYLELDPHETRIAVEFQGSYSCTCKGHGCAKCCEDLAAIARGENPYAHHTTQTQEVLK